jgi:hypothetical protein
VSVQAGNERLRDADAAITVLIARVDRLERVLKRVAAACPVPPMIEPVTRETMAGPNDRQRLEAIGAALSELADG